MKQRWNKDFVTIARILRAPLHFEHYLTEYLQHTNLRLGDVEAARLTFSQKVQLLPHGDRSIDFVIPGIQHLNKVRNKLAHDLSATVIQEDAKVFLTGHFASRPGCVSTLGQSILQPTGLRNAEPHQRRHYAVKRGANR